MTRYAFALCLLLTGFAVRPFDLHDMSPVQLESWMENNFPCVPGVFDCTDFASYAEGYLHARGYKVMRIHVREENHVYVTWEKDGERGAIFRRLRCRK